MGDFAGLWGYTSPQLTTDAGTCKATTADPFGVHGWATQKDPPVEDLLSILISR